jgi:hypothetical protein
VAEIAMATLRQAAVSGLSVSDQIVVVHSNGTGRPFRPSPRLPMRLKEGPLCLESRPLCRAGSTGRSGSIVDSRPRQATPCQGSANDSGCR